MFSSAPNWWALTFRMQRNSFHHAHFVRAIIFHASAFLKYGDFGPLNTSRHARNSPCAKKQPGFYSFFYGRACVCTIAYLN